MSALRLPPRFAIAAAGLAAGAVALAAYSAVAETRDRGNDAVPAKAGYELHFIDTGDTAKLAYGQPQSEIMALMLECAKGSGEVEISDVAQGAGEISLKSGNATATFDGAVTLAPISTIIVADTTADVPVMKAFRRTAKVEVANGKLRYAVTGARPTVEQFFAACGTPA